MLNKQPAGDLWHLKDNDSESQHYGRTIHFDFSYIHSEEMKSVVKDYVWQNRKTAPWAGWPGNRAGPVWNCRRM